MYDRSNAGNNRNKSNMRIANLEALLKSTELTGASAKVNSLKAVIRRNRTDMAPDAKTSLELMRIIFQNEITREIWQILDRHARTTFSPAIENLRRNGHIVDAEVMSVLFTDILENAKKAFAVDPSESNEVQPNCQTAPPPLIIPEKPLPEIQILHHPLPIPPPRQEIHPQIPPYPIPERIAMDLSPLSPMEVAKWNPERFGLPTLFISAVKVSQHMGTNVVGFFNNFPRMFRYICDEHDRRVLADENRLKEPDSPRIYLLCLEDAREITANVQEIEPFAFCVKEALVLKIRRYSQPYYERLLRQKPSTTSQPQLPQWQQQYDPSRPQ